MARYEEAYSNGFTSQGRVQPRQDRCQGQLEHQEPSRWTIFSTKGYSYRRLSSLKPWWETFTLQLQVGLLQRFRWALSKVVASKRIVNIGSGMSTNQLHGCACYPLVAEARRAVTLASTRACIGPDWLCSASMGWSTAVQTGLVDIFPLRGSRLLEASADTEKIC